MVQLEGCDCAAEFCWVDHVNSSREQVNLSPLSANELAAHHGICRQAKGA